MVERVRFAGGGAETGPMTWGQRAIWQSIEWLGGESQFFNIPRVVPIPDGLSSARVTACLGALVEAHESLRTRFGTGPDCRQQTVLAAGELLVPLVEAAPGAVDGTAEATAAELAARPFDHDVELPVRFALVVSGGCPVRLAACYAHVAADYSAVALVERDLAVLMAGGTRPRPDWSPLEQARYEYGPTGSSRGSRALDHWRDKLAIAPVPLFGARRPTAPEGVEHQRFVRVRMDSVAAAAAATAVATRCDRSVSTVLLAATAAVLAAETGHQDAVLRLISSNRTSERSRALVAAMAANALLVLTDLDQGDFDDLVRRAASATVSAYRFATYDPYALDQVIEEARRLRPGLDLSAFFNDTRREDRWPSAPTGLDTGPERLAELAASTRTAVVGSWERMDASFFVHTSDRPDTCRLYITADTELLPVPRITELLRGLEALLIAAADGRVRPGGVLAAARREGAA
jgi:hypothetical protein